MSLLRKIELAAKSLVEGAAGVTVHGSDGLGIVWSPRQVSVTCLDSSDATGMPGNETLELRIEVQTRPTLYVSRADAVTDHHALFDAIVNAILIAELAQELNSRATEAVVVGIEHRNKITHANANDVLSSSLTRTLHVISP